MGLSLGSGQCLYGAYSCTLVSQAGLILVSIAGLVKVAVIPVHVWLGKVHTECATVGSLFALVTY